MEKKIPMRTCVACRTSKPKKELVRIVKNQDGNKKKLYFPSFFVHNNHEMVYRKYCL